MKASRIERLEASPDEIRCSRHPTAALIRSRPSITLFARQLAAAFGALRYFGAIPATTEGLDERDGVYHPAAKNIDRSDLVGESCALGSCDF